jgi:hypothetical protein
VPESSGRGLKRKKQLSLGGALDVGQQEDLPLVNWLRARVKEWREGKLTGIPYDGASSITKELLALWRGDETLRKQRLFFAQVEAAETLVFLIEANPIYHKGTPELPIDQPGESAREAGFKAFTRYACKMATGTGKTTVTGMLSAWSILNRVASPTDDRFSDTILIVCPNVTIRERLQELDPALGDNSLYRTRQLVPPHRMEELRRGEVMIANWHRLAKKETNSVNGTSAKVVKTGEPTEEWKQDSQDELHPVPPVFIVVCRDTKVAAEVFNWLAYEEGSYAAAPLWFRNTPGNEVTVRIDSKVVEELEAGGTKDETQRLRFILDTIGKKTWPGGKVPEEWSELVRKNNEEAASDDNDGTYKWIDERVLAGRNIRCIVSVAMLAEGWDANTVTHIVGLRPFGSQLLCEQVVGRALRRRSYALNEETDQFEEETAKVFGVPFELIPFKVSKSKDSEPPKEPSHIFSDPDKSQYEIEFPIVEGHYSPQVYELEIAWDQVSQVTIDPKEIPNSVELNSMTAPEGSLAVYGPGERPVLTLADWRKQFRLQQVAFRLARQVCQRWQNEQNGGGKSDVAISTSALFPKAAFAAKRFLQEKVNCIGNARPCDVLLAGKYHQQAVDILFEAIRRGGITRRCCRGY